MATVRLDAVSVASSVAQARREGVTPHWTAESIVGDLIFSDGRTEFTRFCGGADILVIARAVREGALRCLRAASEFEGLPVEIEPGEFLRVSGTSNEIVIEWWEEPANIPEASIRLPTERLLADMREAVQVMVLFLKLQGQSLEGLGVESRETEAADASDSG